MRIILHYCRNFRNPYFLAFFFLKAVVVSKKSQNTHVVSITWNKTETFTRIPSKMADGCFRKIFLEIFFQKTVAFLFVRLIFHSLHTVPNTYSKLSGIISRVKFINEVAQLKGSSKRKHKARFWEECESTFIHKNNPMHVSPRMLLYQAKSQGAICYWVLPKTQNYLHTQGTSVGSCQASIN